MTPPRKPIAPLIIRLVLIFIALALLMRMIDGGSCAPITTVR